MDNNEFPVPTDEEVAKMPPDMQQYIAAMRRFRESSDFLLFQTNLNSVPKKERLNMMLAMSIGFRGGYREGKEDMKPRLQIVSSIPRQ